MPSAGGTVSKSRKILLLIPAPFTLIARLVQGYIARVLLIAHRSIRATFDGILIPKWPGVKMLFCVLYNFF
jgi:hypothetical protein